MTGNGRLIGKN